MENKIGDKISIRDSVKATTHLSPELFLEEFRVYKEKYLEKEINKDLIMAYILLQLYLENHFHYHFKFLIGGGLGFKLSNWNERGYVREKLGWFKNLLSDNGFVFDASNFQGIEDYYKEISDIRNKFAHGHPVTETSENSIKTQSEAKLFLTRQKFNDTCSLANKLSDLWNRLLCDLQNQERLLQQSKLPAKHFFDHCKFQMF